MSMATVSAPVWRIKGGKVLETVHKEVPYHYCSVDEEGVITADPATAQQLLYAHQRASATLAQTIDALTEEICAAASFGEGDYGDTPF